MSFGNLNKVFGRPVQELILALMLITVFSVIWLDIDLSYKIGIAVFTFSIIMLASLATAILREQKEMRKQQINQV
ncbi:MAG: hypothetical protein GX799_11365 [Crenarchaeota archaeon]|jgi:hypothetical protein|nr:hypothetical protein [Thermoproteota archaeon]